jgi:hypothetical protein
LRRWNGKGAVRLYDWDPERHALLMERCDPGDHLSSVDADEAMDVFADLLPQLWVDAGAPLVQLRIANALDALHVGGGATPRHQAERVAPSQPPK